MQSLRIAAPLLVSVAALSGCMGSPTYGTGKSANMQLMEDVTGVLSVGDKKREAIAYSPRPDLVKPGQGQQLALVAPQDSVTATGNPAWPESPEARLARIKAEATVNEDNPDYRSPVVVDTMPPKGRASKSIPGHEAVGGPGYNGDAPGDTSRGEEFKRRLAATRGSPTTRKYLSEPPLDYRQAEATAATGDLGEDEWKKERRIKRESRKKGSWADILPW